jgi:hypothetical protein
MRKLLGLAFRVFYRSAEDNLRKTDQRGHSKKGPNSVSNDVFDEEACPATLFR